MAGLAHEHQHQHQGHRHHRSSGPTGSVGAPGGSGSGGGNEGGASPIARVHLLSWNKYCIYLLLTLWEVNALKISVIGTDLVGTSF